MLTRMSRNGNGQYITSRRGFFPLGQLKKSTIETVFNFAYEMTFGGDGEHRDHRSGGSYRRRNGEIFANTFQGKLAECATYNEFAKMGLDVTMPDFNVYKLGKWDDIDIEVNSKSVSIKSTKSFGNLLLLEMKDWNNKGEYIPNQKSYDYTFLVRMDPYCEDLLRQNRMLYTDTIDKDPLSRIITSVDWKYDIAGFITNDDLIEVINNKFIILKGELLNGKTVMDADNYYVQSGDMRKLSEFRP